MKAPTFSLLTEVTTFDENIEEFQVSLFFSDFEENDQIFFLEFAMTLFIRDVTWSTCRWSKKHNLVPMTSLIGLWATGPVQSQGRGPENEVEKNEDHTTTDNVKEKTKN